MKKLILGLILSLTVVFAYAQKEDKEVAKKAKDAYKAAEDAFKKKDFQEAATQIEGSFVSEKYQKDAKAWFTRGEIYEAMVIADSVNPNDEAIAKNIAEAISSFKKAVTLNKNYEILYVQPKMNGLYGHFVNAGVASYQENEYESAMKNFERASLVIPGDTTALFYALTAASLMDDKDFNKIEKYSLELIKAGYTHEPAVYYAILDKYINQDEDYEKAGAILADARKIHPSDRNLLLQEINIAIRNNKLDEAIANMAKAVESSSDPKESFALTLNLGILYERANKIEEAGAAYKKALELDPTNYDAIYSVAAFHYNKGVSIKKEADAMDIDQYRKEGQKVIDKAKVHFNDALPYFLKCRQAKPTDVQVLQALLSIYSINQKNKEAEEVAKLLDELDGSEDN
jgi:tetratricopeptide (TPR) repeat protein